MSAVLTRQKTRPQTKPKDYLAIAKNYARKIVKQKTHPRTIKLTCQRFLDDLEKQKNKGYAYYLSKENAHHICKFAEMMPHVKGDLSKLPYPDNLIKLQPFQVYILVNLFGWLKKKNDLRRYREAYIKIPRKNGKSVLAAVIGNYMFAADGEAGSEVYAGASSKDQANEVFKPARYMALKTPGFVRRFKIRIDAHKLVIPRDGSVFERLVGNPGDGGSPHCAIVDEYHEHKNNNLFNTMTSGMLARASSLLFIITTAGVDVSCPCYAYEKECVSELTAGANDTKFIMMWGLDKPSQWDSIRWLKAVNPNFGVSVVADDLLAKLEEAKRNPAVRSIFMQKHCNEWTSGENAFFNMEHWDNAANPKLKESDFAGKEYYEGVDLASAVDIASRIRIYPEDIKGKRHYTIFGSHYVPEAVKVNPDLKHYHNWIDSGYLIATKGNKIDHFEIADGIFTNDDQSDLNLLGYDGYNADMLISYLERGSDEFDGIDIEKLIKVPQQRKYLSDQIKFIEAELKDGTIHHDGNPCMTWMMSNVVVRKTDHNHDNFHAIKSVAGNKIDGPVALLTGAAVMNSVEEEQIEIGVSYL